MQTEPTRISVIIPTLNAEDTISPIISKLCHQKKPVSEIIIVDSGSTDDTKELVENLGAKVLQVNPGSFDHGKTRNLAANYATGNILIFMTQDALPLDKELTLNLLKPLADPEVALSYARQVPASDASLSEQYLRLVNYPPLSKIKSKEDLPVMGINTFHCSNVCAAYRKNTFKALGGFPQPVVCNEDMIFSARAIKQGYKVAYTAEAKVQHSHDYGYTDLFKRYFDISASLDHQPDIRALGKAESRGFAFFTNQLQFFKEQKKTHMLPHVFLESGAKLLGFKAGASHTSIPQQFKKHFGLNRKYWSSQVKHN